MTSTSPVKVVCYHADRLLGALVTTVAALFADQVHSLYAPSDLEKHKGRLVARGAEVVSETVAKWEKLRAKDAKLMTKAEKREMERLKQEMKDERKKEAKRKGRLLFNNIAIFTRKNQLGDLEGCISLSCLS